MVILKVVKPVRLDGEILQPGDTFRAQNEGQLVARGYARRLNKEEIKSILDGYIEFAEKLFQGEEGIQRQSKEHHQERLF